MSLSKPTDNSPHPCVKWFEWNGAAGSIRWYNKEAKRQEVAPAEFTFILLDKLAVIKGWHDPSQSGITSNEVRDTTSEPFVVKAFEAGVLLTGIYQQIRDRVLALGGHYTANLYIAFREDGKLKIGSLQIKGAALGAWMEFSKANRATLASKAIKLVGFDEGKKGAITFRTPKFATVDISEPTLKEAVELDKILQEYLDRYLSKPKVEQAEQAEHKPESQPPEKEAEAPLPEGDSDVPF